MADWKYFNPNPHGLIRAVDCTIRAICAVTGQDWNTTFTGLALQSFILKDMPSANHVWAAYLKRRGFRRAVIPDSCPDCYTVGDFADEHPKGKFVLGTGSHAVACIDGIILDSFDSRAETPIYFFYKKEDV